MDENIAEFVRRSILISIYVSLTVVVHLYIKEYGYTFFAVVMFIAFTYVKGQIISISGIWRRVKFTIKSLLR